MLVTDIMTVVYTKDTPKSLTKSQIIDLFLKIQDQINSAISKLSEEIKKFKSLLQEVLYRMLKLVKKINDALVK